MDISPCTAPIAEMSLLLAACAHTNRIYCIALRTRKYFHCMPARPTKALWATVDCAIAYYKIAAVSRQKIEAILVYIRSIARLSSLSSRVQIFDCMLGTLTPSTSSFVCARSCIRASNARRHPCKHSQLFFFSCLVLTCSRYSRHTISSACK